MHGPKIEHQSLFVDKIDLSKEDTVLVQSMYDNNCHGKLMPINSKNYTLYCLTKISQNRYDCGCAQGTRLD